MSDLLKEREMKLIGALREFIDGCPMEVEEFEMAGGQKGYAAMPPAHGIREGGSTPEEAIERARKEMHREVDKFLRSTSPYAMILEEISWVRRRAASDMFLDK